MLSSLFLLVFSSVLGFIQAVPSPEPSFDRPVVGTYSTSFPRSNRPSVPDGTTRFRHPVTAALPSTTVRPIRIVARPGEDFTTRLPNRLTTRPTRIYSNHRTQQTQTPKPRISGAHLQENGPINATLRELEGPSSTPKVKGTVKAKGVAQRLSEDFDDLPTIGNEVDNLSLIKDRKAPDDYSDFDSQLPANGRGPNDKLSAVTLSPLRSTFSIPPLPESATQSPVSFRGGPPALPSRPVYAGPRQGFYYQHYPWDRLPSAFALRPELTYIYPRGYENTVWSPPPVRHHGAYGGCGYSSPCGSSFPYQQGTNCPLGGAIGCA